MQVSKLTPWHRWGEKPLICVSLPMFLMQLHRWGGKLPDSRQGNFCEEGTWRRLVPFVINGHRRRCDQSTHRRCYAKAEGF